MKLFELKQIIREEMDNLLSEGLKFHLNNNIRLNENIFRPGSDKYFELFAEVRQLSKNGLYKLDENEKYWINETDIGEFALYEGQKVPLDFPLPLEEKKKRAKKKKNPPLNKPMRNTGGGKKYKVFVRDKKTGNIKKVTFGDKKGGLEGNWNNPKARASFAKRHRCAEKNDKTKAGYWACRIGRYPKVTGAPYTTWW